MASFGLEFRHCLRTLRRNPGFAIGTIAVLALGIGESTAIFTVAKALVFERLPFREPDRLVAVWKQRTLTGARQGASFPDLADWGAQSHIFTAVAAYMDSTGYASPSDPNSDSQRVSDIQVTESFFPLLGVRPAIGRLFSHGEFAEQYAIVTEAPVIVSHAFWRNRLGAKPDTVGTLVNIDGVRRLVVGVLPPEFRMFRNSTPEVFSPLRPFPGHLVERRMAYLTVVARLRPGITVSQAKADMLAYSRRAAKEHPDTEAGLVYDLESLHEHWFGPMRPVMLLLLGAVALVLLIACANVAFLLLVRAARREREIAVRMALGAGKARIRWQLMAEGLLLGVCAGAVGFIAALWGRDLFAAFSSAADMGLPQIEIDGSVIAFTILVSLATSVLFALLPAWRSGNIDLHRHLKAGAANASAGIASQRFGRAAIIGEIGLSTLLLAGTAVLLESFITVTRSHPGFQPERTLTLSIARAPLRGNPRDAEPYFWSRLLERAGALPAVEAVAVCRAFPLSEDGPPAKMIANVTPEGRSLQAPGFVTAEFQDVSPGYFRAIGIPVLKGRSFDSRDAKRSDPRTYLPVAVINQRFARELWGSEDPIGKHIVSGGQPYTVIGLAADVKQHGLWKATPEAVIYRPLWQTDLFKWPAHFLVLRTTDDPRRTAAVIRALVKSLDPERNIASVRTMEDVMFQSTAWDRLRLGIIGAFGAAALLLTIAGVYAVISHSVLQRRREIGIRIALGGRPESIRTMILRQGTAAAIAGVSAGAFAAWALSRVFAGRVHGVSAADLPTLAAVAVLLVAATLAACYFPARKATRVDPCLTLRAD